MLYPWDDPNDPNYDPLDRSKKYPPGSTAPDPSLNHPPENDPHVIPVTDPTAPPTDANRPPKPDDPGDGRVWIWMGDHWGLTEPITPIHGPQPTGQAPLGDFSAGNFDWPSYAAPDWIGTPAFDPGPAFTFADFAAPDPQSITKDPAYNFRFDQGVKALGANRAGKGTFLSGETGKALEDFGQKAASQEYDNVFNRALTSYDTNRNNSFQNWAAQYGQRKDKYGFLADENARHNTFNQSNAQADFSGKNSQAMAKFQDLFNRYKAQGDWLAQLAQDPG